jgi:hypothetical protein
MMVGAREDPIHHPYHCLDTQIILRSIEFIPILLRRMGWDQFFSSVDPDSIVELIIRFGPLFVGLGKSKSV